MKKIIAMAIVLALAAMAAAGSAEAAEKKKSREVIIQKAVCEAYAPRRVTVQPVQDEDKQYQNGVLIDCTTNLHSEYLRIFVYNSGVVLVVYTGGNKKLEEKVIAYVQTALNPPASVELQPGKVNIK